jgi:glycine/D-amino acid oxidase-like deaminating enzyme
VALGSYRPVVVGGGIVEIASVLALGKGGYGPIVLEAEDGLARPQTGHSNGAWGTP